MRFTITIALIGFMFTQMIMAQALYKDAKSQNAEQAQVAMTYIKRLTKGELNLKEHTALSRHCGPERLNKLRTRIEFLRKNDFRENDSLSIEIQKTDANLAAVLIRAENPVAPLSPHIHAVALIRKKDLWLAAPLPGLFSNTGYGYDHKIEQSVRALERWMAREKTLRELDYIRKANSDIKSKLVIMEQKAGFDEMSSEQAVTFFLEQCRNKNLLGIATSMGGASDALADSLDTTITLIAKGLEKKNDPDSDWFLLTSRSVIVRILEFDEKRAEVALGFYNPMAHREQSSKVIRFPVRSAKDKTFTHLPPSLQASALAGHDSKRHGGGHAHDYKLQKRITAAIFENLEVVKHSSPEDLLNQFLDSIKKNDFTGCLRLTPRKGSFYGNEKNHEAILSNLGNLWRNIHSLNLSPSKNPYIIKEENLALAPLLYEKTNQAGVFETIKIWMLQDDDGWHLISPLSLHKVIGEKEQAATEKIEELLLAQEKKQREEHAREFLNKVVTITAPHSLDTLSEKDALKVFTNFRNDLRAKDTQAILSSCAVISGISDPQTLLTFINYALRGASDHTDQDHILGTTRKGDWIGLSVKTVSKLSGMSDYPLYIVVNTAQGARILIDVDLRHATNRGRTQLNQKNWDKLEKTLPQESVDILKAIFTEHLKFSIKDIAKASKDKE